MVPKLTLKGGVGYAVDWYQSMKPYGTAMLHKPKEISCKLVFGIEILD